MKKCFLTFLIQLLFQPVFSQDSTKITYTQETDTLIKQRFIDRYENVFMTKVPTRHMFKIGVSQYYQAMTFPLIDDKAFSNLSIQLGYEFKFLPAFSISLSGYLPYYGLTVPVGNTWRNAVLEGQVRWYYDMKKRIKSGASANNFSGNYIGLNYTVMGTDSDVKTIGLVFGFQRRFLNSGFMDFAFTLRQEQPWFHYGIGSNWTFSSVASFGIALGDWKKHSKIPLCDVLICNSDISKQFKVKLPELTFGYYANRIRAGVAFEQKIGSSPLTLNFQLDAALNKSYDYFNYESSYKAYRLSLALSTEMSASFSLQPRFYFLQKRNRLRGKTSNGISGFYSGINSEFSFYSGRHGLLRYGERDVKYNLKQIYAGPLIGFQQRLFKHGYVDFNTSYNYQRELNYGTNALRLRTNLGVGFAF